MESLPLCIRMKRVGYLIFLLVPLLTFCQSFTDSNLPIVLISTDGNVGIPDAPRILATMKIIYKGPGVRNALTDQTSSAALNYDGRINIEIRGSSSQALEKKQYGLSTLMPDNKTNNNISLLGMPAENDWVLNSLAFDPSLIRDHISYTLSRAIGEYAPRTVFCEVVINGNYVGLYMLQEKIKIDRNRVNIVKIGPNDNTQPDISGGYIIKADKITPEDPSAWAVSSYLGSNDVNFVYESPKTSAITYEQGNYIKSIFNQLQNAATNNNSSITDGFPSIIDIPSFLNFMIMNELSANVDAYQFSTFFHKDKRGKLRAGPLWDLNLTYSNDLFFWGFDRSKTDRWQFDNGDNVGARFWKDLYNNPIFKCYLSKRWNSLSQAGQPLNLSSLNALIDETVNRISEAVVRETSRWGSVGSHQERIDGIKTYLTARMSWMTSLLGSFASCENVTTPPLVISKIMYNPSTSTQFPSSSDQEFIEIVNTGNDPIDMAGYYFSGTGFVYQFPAGFFFPPQGVLHLANHIETFEQKYGISPFGEFTRDLSNETQKLTLVDAFGNVADEVQYTSTAPWPDVSGNGSYLKVKDPNLDNSLPISWTTSDGPLTTNVISGLEDYEPVEVFPNPTYDMININSSHEMNAVTLSNIQGSRMDSKEGSFKSVTFATGHYPIGVYLVSIKTNSKIQVRKIVKTN